MTTLKKVNDNVGHYFGDLVLSDIAIKIKKCFSEKDIVGRLGGDEFIVFATNLLSCEALHEKAKEIISATKGTHELGEVEYTTSCSIGVSRFFKDGDDFSELYQTADTALYALKRKGKGCYTVYSDELMSSKRVVTTL